MGGKTLYTSKNLPLFNTVFSLTKQLRDDIQENKLTESFGHTSSTEVKHLLL